MHGPKKKHSAAVCRLQSSYLSKLHFQRPVKPGIIKKGGGEASGEKFFFLFFFFLVIGEQERLRFLDFSKGSGKTCGS
jgi:hypothetical protein